MTIIKRILLAILALGLVTVYTIRSFNPQQPLHHQLNDAGGVVLLALFLTYFFFPSGDDD
jgi:hypothetical protein